MVVTMLTRLLACAFELLEFNPIRSVPVVMTG